MDNDPKKTFKIVVIDDSDFSRKSIAKILEDAGYNVVGEVSNAEDALKLMQNGPADLYIIDVVMPDVSGLELANKIRENQAQAGLIMMSSLYNDSLVIEAISNGANDFLKKPFRSTELLMSVNRMMQLHLSDVN
ncbi:MAG: response regulator [Bdellovibrio sp.]|nr:response regulator [Bdellovibrio sp.]